MIASRTLDDCKPLQLARIRTRVKGGGHDIPAQDAKRRFHRSLEQLPEIISQTDRTVLYRVVCGRGRNTTVSVSTAGTARRIPLICRGFSVLTNHTCDSARAG